MIVRFIAFLIAMVPTLALGSGLEDTMKRTVTMGSSGKVETYAEGKQACDMHWDKKNANDPCNQAHVFEQGAKAQAFSAKIYAVASVVCLSECAANTGGTVCTLSTFGAAAAETGYAIKVGAASQNILAQIGGPLASAGVAVGASKSGASKRTQSCMAFGMNALQSTVRWNNYGTSKESANEAYRQKLTMMSEVPKIEMAANQASSNGGATGGGGADSQQNIGGINDSITEKTADNSNEKSFEESAIEAGQLPMLRQFEKLSGKSASGLDERINAGMPPLLAAGDMAAGALGPQGVQSLGQFAAQSGGLAARLKDDLDEIDRNIGITASAGFEGGRGGARASASSDDAAGMPDLQALMAQFLPQDQNAAKPKSNVVQVQFTGRSLAAQTPEKGIHAPTRSLFEIVGARYQLLSSKFLTGENVRSGTPQSLLPSNPYLRK